METKAELRHRMRQKKRQYTERQLSEKSEGILRQVESMVRFRRSKVVAVYWSLPDEVGTHLFVEKWSAGKTILLPVMCPEDELELREYRPGCVMKEASFCIREPEGPVFSPHEVDLILVPGVAFDLRGHRLGRGKGFYDRLLGKMTAYKVGLCFDFQILDEIPVAPHDIAMDGVVYG